MRKTLLKVFATLFMGSMLALGLSACGETGVNSSSSEDSAHEHAYTATVTDPTCTEDGFTTHTCECGESYVDTYVDALGHSFTKYISDNNATYDEDGTKTAKCDREECNATDTVTDTGSILEDKLVFKTLSVDGTDVYGKFSNAIEVFSFTDEIISIGNAKYIVALDEYGMQTVATKTISLTPGDNTVYILEMLNDEVTQIYTVTLRRRLLYTVSFNTKASITVKSQTVEEDSYATQPDDIPKKPAYTFTGWNYDFTQPITKSTTITAEFSLNAEMELFNFTSTNTTCTITGIKDTTVTEIVVPDYVTSIRKGAFMGCNNLTDITLPFIGLSPTETKHNAVLGSIFGYARQDKGYGVAGTTIQYSDNSYNYCYYLPTNLKSVTITSAETIAKKAFCNCSSLRDIKIPDSVTSIGEDAFYYCSNLKDVYITDIEAWCNISFDNNNANPLSQAYNLYLNNELLTKLIIPDTITEIKPYAFYTCNSLNEIIIHDSVTSIDKTAFQCCHSLTGVYITDITAWCNISFASASENPLSQANNLYLNNELLTKLIIPDTINEIKPYVFYGCSSLAEIVIPESVNSIGESAFYNCNGLATLTILDGVTSIGLNAFYGCSGLTEIVVPESVNSIGEGAFYNCNGLTTVTILDGVTSIGLNAFYGCSGLTQIVVPESVTSIGEGAFRGCNSLTKMTLPFIGGSRDVKSTTSGVFGFIFGYETSTSSWISEATCQYYNSASYIYYHYYIPRGLTSITVTSAEKIGSNAFYNCSWFTEIIIPDSVTTIGLNAFYGCNSLAEITLPFAGTSPTATTYSAVFGYIFGYEVVNGISSPPEGAILQYSSNTAANSAYRRYYYYNIPKSLKCVKITSVIGEDDFYNCSGLTSVTIGNGVISIGDTAFYNCTNLISITFEGTVAEWETITKGSGWNRNVPATKVVCLDGEVSL